MSTSASPNKIGLGMAIAICLNAMIGVGIFLAPAALACTVGPAGILTYIFVIFAVWCMGSSIARLAYLYPQEGSFYIYTKQWAGHIGALIAVFSYLIGLTVAMGLLAQIVGIYLHDYSAQLAVSYAWVPDFSAQTWSIISVVAFTLLNMAGNTAMQASQIILLVLTLFPLFATIVLCMPSFSLENLKPFMPFGVINIFVAAKSVIFGFFGFESATSLYGMVKDPEKTVSRALTWAILITGAIYMSFVTALMLAIPASQFCAQAPITQTLEAQFPQAKLFILSMHIAIVFAILGTIYSVMWSVGALLYVTLKKMKTAVVHTLIANNILNHRVCTVIIGAGILASFLLLKNIDLFFSVTSIFIVSAYISSIITLLTLKKEWQSGENMRTVAGLLTACMILYFSVQNLMQALVG
ncbi:MAG: APC family permease [Candidatus Babeliales bacterium]